MVTVLTIVRSFQSQLYPQLVEHAPSPKVVRTGVLHTRCVKNEVKIKRVYVEPVVMCVLDVVIQVTMLETALSYVPKVSVVILQLVTDCMHFRLAMIIKFSLT